MPAPSGREQNPASSRFSPNALGRLAVSDEARFIEIPRERGGSKVPFTEEHLTAIRGGLTAEEYRWKTIRKWLRD